MGQNQGSLNLHFMAVNLLVISTFKVNFLGLQISSVAIHDSKFTPYNNKIGKKVFWGSYKCSQLAISQSGSSFQTTDIS